MNQTHQKLDGTPKGNQAQSSFGDFAYPNAAKPPATTISFSKRNHFPLLFIFFSLIFIFALFKGADFIVKKADGKLDLSDDRRAKLEKELEDLDEAEQYVLLATRAGNFPCYSCIKNKTIWLLPGEVWKYGVTTKGEKGRYKKGLPVKHLLYKPQLIGSLDVCLKEEKRKIYYYALLPENTKRNNPLIRPPGNKIDK